MALGKEAFARNLARAISYNLKAVDLAPVKQIKVSFDPFGENVLSARKFAYAVSSKRQRNTNPECSIKVDVKSDRSEPFMEVAFGNGKKALFKTRNLEYLDILKEFNKLCTKHNPKASEGV